VTRGNPVIRVTTTMLAIGVLVVPVGMVSAAAAPIGAAARADNADDLTQKKQTLENKLAAAGATYESASSKVQAAALAYTEATAELPDARTALATANGGVIAATVAIDAANARVVSAQSAAVTAQAAVDTANIGVTDARTALSKVVAASYEGSDLIQLNAFMDVQTPGDILNGLGYLDLIATNRRQALTGLVNAQLLAQDALNSAIDAQHAAETAQQTAATALAGRQTALTSAKTASDAVAALVAKRAAALVVARQNRAATLAEYRDLQKQSDAVAGQLAALAAGERKRKPPSSGGAHDGGSPTGPITSTVGFFPMPVHGRESSPFGMRFDPFYQRWQLHAGVDIAAGGGTPIKVAGSGRVIRAGWAGGYGNYTCVSHGLYEGPGPYHGKGLATCYAHQSHILVRVGQHVAKGQVIGQVGETGAATGYHLHFEVRIDGRPVQPVSWLPRCFC
jgi:murein DD-endopeptidase MepM/ murein hydrolase activator NlpD